MGFFDFLFGGGKKKPSKHLMSLMVQPLKSKMILDKRESAVSYVGVVLMNFLNFSMYY